MNKFVLFLLLMIQMSLIAHTEIYYVSNAGSDSNNGTTTENAWQTLSKVNGFTFASGDVIQFKRGDTFYGSITVPRSDLTFGAYDTGNNPIISGFETLSGWSDQGNGIYRATTTATVSCNVVTVNGVNTPKGRYPKTGWLVYESSVGRTSITDTQLTNTPNWTGAEAVIMVNNWTIERSLITNHTNSTITYTAGSPGYTEFETSAGSQYFIQNDVKTLTALGDWYCDGTHMYMYFGANDPSTYVVKASVIDKGIVNSTKNRTNVSNLIFEGFNTHGIYVYLSSTISITNCTTQLGGYSGIFGDSNNGITVDGCTSINNNGSGVDINSTAATVKNSIIDNNGMTAGMASVNGIGHTAITVRSTGGLIEYNKVSNSGYNGIMFFNNNMIVRYNEVYNTNSVLTDGGGIYTYVGSATPSSTGQKVYNNIIHDCGANGLYNDNFSNNIEWYNNTVVNAVRYGFHSNFPYSTNIHDNKFYNTNGFSIQNAGDAVSVAHDNTISNNIVVQGAIDQTLFTLRDLGTFRVQNFGTSDNNTFIGIDGLNSTAYFYDMHLLPSYVLTNRNFTDWKTLTSKEANSTLMFVSLSSITIAYNASSVAATVPLPFVCEDLSGMLLGESVTLQPFTSIICVRYSSVTNPNGWKKTRVLNNGKVMINSRNGNRVMVKE